jgi:hypothetical protein
MIIVFVLLYSILILIKKVEFLFAREFSAGHNPVSFGLDNFEIFTAEPPPTTTTSKINFVFF